MTWLPRSPPTAGACALVAATVRVRLGVAVWAEQPQVGEPVIISDPVDVVEVEHQLPAAPFADAAFITHIMKEAAPDQAPLEPPRIGVGTALNKNRFQRHTFLHGPGCASPMTLCEPVRCIDTITGGLS